MKRQKKTIEKRTYSMKGAIPMFVSLVGRGANFTPFTNLKYDESEKFGQDVEINRIEFAKSTFASKEDVEQYLIDNAYEQFSVDEGESTWVVLGQDAEKFEEVAPIEYEDGVLYFIGKLKAPEEEVAPAADVTSVEEFGDTTSEVVGVNGVTKVDPNTEVDEHNAEVDDDSSESQDAENKEVVEEEDLGSLPNSATTPPDSAKKLKKKKAKVYSDEEVESKEQTSEHSESQEGFSAEEGSEEEVETFSLDSVNKLIETIKAEFKDEIDALKAELEVFKQKQEETVDENQIIVQHSQAVNSDEIIKEEEQQKDEKAVKFSQNRTNDLFGLRG